MKKVLENKRYIFILFCSRFDFAGCICYLPINQYHNYVLARKNGLSPAKFVGFQIFYVSFKTHPF